MANADNPRGLRPVRYLSGACYTGAVNRYYIPASDTTDTFPGGLVKLAGDADSKGIASVTGDVATGDAMLGVVVAVEMVTRDSTTYRAASTERYVHVADDPNLLFEVQDDGAAAPTSANVGNVADLAGFTLGNTVTGRSEMEVSAASLTDAGDGTEDVVLIGLTQDEGNEFSENANWLVRLNNHALVNGSTGA